MGALSPVLYAFLASATCVLCQRFSIFSLSSIKDRADIDPQNKYHPTALAKVFSLVLFCWCVFDSHVHESRVPRLCFNLGK